MTRIETLFGYLDLWYAQTGVSTQAIFDFVWPQFRPQNGTQIWSQSHQKLNQDLTLTNVDPHFGVQNGPSTASMVSKSGPKEPQLLKDAFFDLRFDMVL